MDAPRFFCPAFEPGDTTLDPAELRHALGSRRLRVGDELILFDGRGRLGHARLVLASGSQAARGVRAARWRFARPETVHVDRVLVVPPPARCLTLVTAACKGQRLDWLVEKCTELGVGRLVLSRFERSVVRPETGREEKLRRVAIEACKQCRRAWLPTIEVRASLAAVLGDTGHDALLVADPDEAAPSLASWLHGHGPNVRRLTAVVGPEGGLTSRELELLRAAGAQIVRLADHILRVETAAVAIAANWAARGG